MKPTQVEAVIHVQDEYKCDVTSVDDNETTPAEEEISTLLHDTSTDDKGDDE